MNMNTNGNTYTIIYTTIIVVLVAAILAFASMSLKSKQQANVKAETISQMLTAAHFYTKDECSAMGNDKVLEAYSSNIKSAFAINASGQKVRDLNTDVKNIELIDNLKAQDKNIRNGKEVELPVYIFSKDGKDVTVVPCYGAGLWGAVWGYLAFDQDDKTFVGAYFDHESETPGLGAKIKDDPNFRAEFVGKVADYNADPIFEIVKGGAPEGQENAVDAITGATMTSKGLSKAIDTWLEAYKPYLSTNGSVPMMTLTPAQPADSSAAAPADSANIK
jgi:Na+-transporting NADH:ubiquinone oxidoreductase subunit C